MSDLNYNVNVNVEGAEDVQNLRDDVAELDEKVDNLDGTATVAVDATGVTETAEGLDAIGENTDAAGVLDDVGTAAGEAAPKADEAAGAFGEMAGAFGLVQAAGFGIDFIMDKIAEKAARIKAQDAFDAAQVQEFADALRQAGDDAANLVDTLTEGGDITGSFRGTEFDITADLAEANITADEYFRTLREDGVAGMNALITQADEAGVSENGLQRIRLAAGETLGNLGVANVNAAASNEVFAESQQSANAALQELLDKDDPMRRFGDEWETLVNGIRDGTVDTQAGADAINTLAVGLDLSTEEVLALAQAQVDEGVAGAQAYNEALGGIDFREADIAGATSAFSEFTSGLFAAGNEVQAREAAFDALKASVDGYAFTMNAGTEAGRAQQDALEGVARVLDTDLTQAYDDANGSQDTFVASATKLGDETLARLQTDLGLTDEQVNGLRTTLGLTAADYEARFNLAGAAEAQIQLGLLQGAIEGLPPEVETVVNTLITQGDYVAARDTVANYYAENPVPLTTTADTTGAETGIAEVADADHPTTIVADADTVTAASDLLDTALEPRTATIVAHAHTAGAVIDLDAVSEPRSTTINAIALTGLAEQELDNLARSRTAYINVVMNTRIFGRRS